jgi:hypothetical protein
MFELVPRPDHAVRHHRRQERLDRRQKRDRDRRRDELPHQLPRSMAISGPEASTGRLPKRAPDGLHVEPDCACTATVSREHRDERPGHSRRHLRPQQDDHDRQSASTDECGVASNMAPTFAVGDPLFREVRGHRAHLEPEKVLHLRHGEDDHGDARGESGDHGYGMNLISAPIRIEPHHDEKKPAIIVAMTSPS